LGTSLGISTLYLSLSSPVTTIEGDPAVAEIARSNFSAFQKENIESIISTFDDYFLNKSLTGSQFQLVFIDGDHRSEALLRCYDQLEKHITQDSIIVVDDIYWSPDMTHGWNQLIEKQEVTQSVNCFHFGLLFFNPDFLDKKHHIIRLPFRSLLK
jgi:predicted O-methyltransferase YrrM